MLFLSSSEPMSPGDPLHIAFLFGTALVINIVWRVAERIYHGRHTRRDHGEWVEDVRRVLYQLCNVEVERAELLANLAEHMKHCPAGYEGIARDSLARSLALVPAAAQMAEDMGLFIPGTFQEMRILPGHSTPHIPTQAPPALHPAQAGLPLAPPPMTDHPPPADYQLVGTQVVPLRAV